MKTIDYNARPTARDRKATELKTKRSLAKFAKIDKEFAAKLAKMGYSK